MRSLRRVLHCRFGIEHPGSTDISLAKYLVPVSLVLQHSDKLEVNMVVIRLHLGSLLDQMAREPLLMPAFHHGTKLSTHRLQRSLSDVVQNKLDFVLSVFARLLEVHAWGDWLDTN